MSRRFTRLEFAANTAENGCSVLAGHVAERANHLFETNGIEVTPAKLALQTSLSGDPEFVAMKMVDWGIQVKFPSGHAARLVAARRAERGSPIHVLAATSRNHAFALATVTERTDPSCSYVQLGMDGLRPDRMVAVRTDTQDPERFTSLQGLKRLLDTDPRRAKEGFPTTGTGSELSSLYHRVREDAALLFGGVQDPARRAYAAAAVLAGSYDEFTFFSGKRHDSHPCRSSDGTLKFSVARYATHVRRELGGKSYNKIAQGKATGSHDPVLRRALLNAWFDNHDVPATEYDKQYPALLAGTAEHAGTAVDMSTVLGPFDAAVEANILGLSALARSGKPIERREEILVNGEKVPVTAILKAEASDTTVMARQWVHLPGRTNAEYAGDTTFNLYAQNSVEPRDIEEIQELLA